jgi:hypothetical protein
VFIEKQFWSVAKITHRLFDGGRLVDAKGPGEVDRPALRARPPLNLGAGAFKKKTRTHFTFRVDTWTPDGQSIVEHTHRRYRGLSGCTRHLPRRLRSASTASVARARANAAIRLDQGGFAVRAWKGRRRARGTGLTDRPFSTNFRRIRARGKPKRARNAAYQARWRERRAGLVAQAIIEGDSDRVIVRKIIEAVGPERTRGIAKRMNSLIERPGWASRRAHRHAPF